MKIIDAHLHLFPENEPQFEEMAQSVGHHNSAAHLRQAYRDLGIVHGVVMGNRSLRAADHDYPADLFHYCVGLDSALSGRVPPRPHIWRSGLRKIWQAPPAAASSSTRAITKPGCGTHCMNRSIPWRLGTASRWRFTWALLRPPPLISNTATP